MINGTICLEGVVTGRGKNLESDFATIHKSGCLAEGK